MFCARDWNFIHIPKTGGTNLYICASYFENTVKCNIDERSVTENILQKHNTVRYWKDKGPDWLAGRKYFTIVRNPYVRAVSFWHHMLFQKPMSFESFVKDKVSINDYYPNHGQDIDWDVFMPQVKYIDSTVETFKMETRLPDLEQYLKFPFINHRAYEGRYYDYRKYYNDELQELVYNCFESDFKSFDYSEDLV